MQKRDVPYYNANLSVDGNTYQVSIRIAEGMRAAEDVPVHSHSQYELLAFFNGSTQIQTGNTTHRFLGGECCLLQPRTYHLRRCSPDTTKYCTFFFQASDPAALPGGGVPCMKLRCAPRLLEWFAALEQELRTCALGGETNVRALASLILVAVLRELAGQQSPATPNRQENLVRYEDIIDDYIALHYAEDLKIGELAEQAGITPRHLARIMQRSYGCTFRQRLLEIRLYYAREYLITTQLPVSRIAIRCGFTAESAFSAAFRKSVGCTPTQYRREHSE